MAKQVLALSTRNPRLPAGCKASDILSGANIPIMPGSAIGTRPISDFQRQGLLIGTATRTGFTGRREAIHHHHLAAIPRRFIGDLAAKFSHTHVGNRARQAVVLDHPLDVQVFEGDDIGAADYRRGGLVQEVSAHRRNVGVNLGDLDPLPSAAGAA